MSKQITNTGWWLSKSDDYWTLGEIMQLRKDLPEPADFWEVFALYEDPFEHWPGQAVRESLGRLILIDHQQSKKWYDSNPVVVKESAFVPKSTVAAIGKMCIPFGLAVVFDQGRLTLVGRKEPVNMLDQAIAQMAKRCQSMQSMLPREEGKSRRKQVADWWGVFDEEAKYSHGKYQADLEFVGQTDRVMAGYKARVSLLKLQHAVCQVSKSFRDWHPPTGSPEVVLKPVDDGGRLLGGVVWVPETYETRQGLAFLGLDRL